jgi:hypothetical protein
LAATVLEIPEDTPGFSEKLIRDLNLQGSHSGGITEESIAFTCWIAVEAERRLRYKIFDLIKEITEEFKSRSSFH